MLNAATLDAKQIFTQEEDVTALSRLIRYHHLPARGAAAQLATLQRLCENSLPPDV